MAKVRAFIIIVLAVFICTAGPIFISNGLNIFEFSMSTWEIIISAGCFGVVAYLMAVLAPLTIQPSAGLRFPEA
jgi:hypothetical protein